MSGRSTRSVALAVAVLFSAGCSKSESPKNGVAGNIAATLKGESELLQRAKSTVSTGVGLDPSKNDLRNVYVVEGNAVCGEINWEAMGGRMIGFSPFIYRYGIEVKDSGMPRSGKFAQVWQSLCESRPVIEGTRAPLPADRLEDYKQRLAQLAANGGKEAFASWERSHFSNLEQIEKDLDVQQAEGVQAQAAKAQAEAEAFTEKMRESMKK